jgi:hypothetical protein
VFDYNQRPIDDKARDNYEKIFKHGVYATNSVQRALQKDKDKSAKLRAKGRK